MKERELVKAKAEMEQRIKEGKGAEIPQYDPESKEAWGRGQVVQVNPDEYRSQRDD